ncbi:D-alanyl-D-alanine carboxypeptidase family protein, partial [Francisella tularensis]
KYGFKLSFPCNNEYGFIYEPWHWCYHNENC